MSIGKQGPTRRTLLGAAAAGAALGALPSLIRPVAAADNEFKIGVFIPLSGPASLFGPSSRACAELAAGEVNKNGGILGRSVKLIPTDAGGPPAESAKSAVRLMLERQGRSVYRHARQRHARGAGVDHQRQGPLHLHAGL